MSNGMKAIKTEYRGVIFDSKSEAVFARTLDIAGVHWIHHPGEHCGHPWDFLIVANSIETLIEYKPAMPTMTYVRNLTEAMSANPVESILIWGNPWNGKARGDFGRADCCYVAYPIFSSFAKYGWGDFEPIADCGVDEPYSNRHEIRHMLGITEPMAQEAMRYRFDLQQNDAPKPFVLGVKKSNRHQIKLTARADEPWRLTRLANLRSCLEHYDGIAKNIEELRDEKGFLVCVWKAKARTELDWYATVAQEWAGQNEPMENVEFEYAR